MNKLHSIHFFIITLIVGCNSATNTHISHNKIVINNIEEKTIGDLFAHTQNNKIICLETTSESIINDISDMRNINKKLYIYDKRQKSIFIFDDDGRFINKISRTGKSQSEYFNIKSFDVSNNGNIVILDNMGMKLLLINSAGEVMKSIILSKKSDYETISFITDSTFCITSKGIYEKYIGNDYTLHTFDMSGSLLRSELSLGKEYNNLILNENFKVNIFKENSKLHFNFPFNNRIFVKDQDSVYCKTEIVFEGMDNADLLSKDTDKLKNDGIIEMLKNGNITTLGSPFIDKEDYILTNVYNADPTIKYLFYDKIKQKSIYYKFNIKSNDVLAIGKPIIYNGDGNRLITITNPTEVMRIVDGNITNETHKLLVEQYKKAKINEEQNPILHIFELKI